MLSKKLTFSLTSLVMLLALGFVLAPTALADVQMKDGKAVAHEHQGAVPKVELSTIDVSAAPGNQVVGYNAIGNTTGPTGSANSLPIATAASAVDTQAEIDALIREAALSTGIIFFIRLHTGVANLDDSEATTAAADVASTDLHISDITVAAFDRYGSSITGTDVALNKAGSMIEHRNKAFPDGRNFKVTISQADIADITTAGDVKFMTLDLGGGAFTHADPADVLAARTGDGTKTLSPSLAAKSDGNGDGDIDDDADPAGLQLVLVNAEPTLNVPKVVSIVRVVPTTAAATSRFTSAAVSEPFDVRITFTEEPNFLKENNKRDLLAAADLPISVVGGKILSYAKGTPFYLAPDSSEGNYAASDANDNAVTGAVPAPTGRDARYHPYLLTIDPDLTTEGDVVIRVKGFNDLTLPPRAFSPPNNLALEANRSVLRVQKTGVKIDDTARDDATKTLREGKRSNEIIINGRQIIPANGYLVLARGADAAAAGVKSVGANKYKDDDKRVRLDGGDTQTDIDFSYNINYGVAFPAPGDDLELFFRNGGTIELRYEDAPDNTVDKAANQTGYHGARTAADEGITAGSVVISEIMWGTSQGSTDMQWIELHNPSSTDLSIDANEWVLRFNGPTLSLDSVFKTVVDTVGNQDANTYWEVPGSPGKTATNLSPEMTLTSMFRKIAATIPDGTKADSWMASPVRPVINVLGSGIGTPGAATPYTAPPPPPDPVVVPPTPVPPATASDLRITEIMVASSAGRLPQWIEITNVSVGEVSLEGWVVGIDNASDDADVVASSLSIKLDGVTLDAGQSALVVSKTGRNSGVAARSKGDDNVGALDSKRIVNAHSQIKPASKVYSMLSETSFRISLEPPLPLAGGVSDRGDVVGNLGGGWDLEMVVDGRSSLIRREMDGASEIAGTDAAGWVLFSDTSLLGAYVETYYGDKDDKGTPGYDAGGALPVELSKFSAARDRVTGQVVITWETQSELNNAGFFIKRAQQKTAQFVPVNPTMIPGAGTTSEKQSYTYTDTTAKPNIVYYYQIEDVSLDGNRQTLTRSHRLKGHIGAAGKLTTMWGELKERE